MDQDLLRDALTNRARRLQDRRRARFALFLLLGLAVVGIGWQLVLAGVTVDLLVHWWPTLAAAVALLAAGVLWVRTRPSPAPLSGEGRWSRIGGMVTTVTAVGALVFTVISLQATRDQIDVAREGQITDRFTRAVDQLGAEGPENVHRRLGGIYALERIAVDSPRDQATMVEILSAFLRSTSPRTAGVACAPTPADVSAAFAVLARRDVARDPGLVRIDLRKLCLRDVDAVDGDLTGMSLVDADLSGAHIGLTSFERATMVGVYMFGADMTDGFVWADEADLTGVQRNDYTRATDAIKDGATTGAWW